jgi:cell wall-associated NlpC family hydrolase
MRNSLTAAVALLLLLSSVAFGFNETGENAVYTIASASIPTNDKDSCSTEVDSTTVLVDSSFVTKRADIVASVIKDGKKLLGLPYRATGIAAWPLDCSGFVSYIYSLHNVKLPRSSSRQAEVGEEISLKEAIPGDLLFFTGRNAKSGKVGHVAMVVKNDNGKITMIHSCNRGISFDEFPKMKYYKERFIKCVRIKIDPTLAKV